MDCVAIRPTSCFCFTKQGRDFADQFLGDILSGDQKARAAALKALVLGRFTPRFDRHDRIFVSGLYVLKEYRQHPGNQELVLTAGEELEWPEWWDDPLSPHGNWTRKEQFHSVKNALNRNQHPYLIHFKGDGTGTRFGWEYQKTATPATPAKADENA